MPAKVSTVKLLAVIQDGFAYAKDKDDPLYKTAQSLLSVLALHLRTPIVRLDDTHVANIHELEAAVAVKRRSVPRQSGTR